ncbi:hypothetical protein QE357_002912 [Siphonobacter sp. BAB-5404]|nr:hypothetical protein [Siphonobacter sp. SORGH_AS_1065]MDR6195860.1 hypothetical protein [Siphonobacter sp. SORGH_AS_0500]
MFGGWPNNPYFYARKGKYFFINSANVGIFYSIFLISPILGRTHTTNHQTVTKR